MKEKTTTKKGNNVGNGWVNLKIRVGLMERLRDNKKKTMVPAGKVAEVAITKYLDEQNNKSQ